MKDSMNGSEHILYGHKFRSKWFGMDDDIWLPIHLDGNFSAWRLGGGLSVVC